MKQAIKPLGLLSVLLVSTLSLAAQRISINAGINFSRLEAPQTEIFHSYLSRNNVSVTLSLNQHKWLTGALEMGYARWGGKETNSYLTSYDVELSKSYLYLQPELRFVPLQTPNGFSLYAGVGPQLSVLVDNNYVPLATEYKMSRLMVGVAADVGFEKTLGRHALWGLSLGYNHQLSPSATSRNQDLRISSFRFLVSVGYVL